MELAQMKVKDFTDLVASEAPAPGGGSVAALGAALGVGLTVMVACLTQGRKKYEDYAPFAARVEQEGKQLTSALVELMDRDTRAFQQLSAAFGLPKGSEEEKQLRSAAIQAGLKGCTETPLEMMRLSARAIRLTDAFLRQGYNSSSASDLGVAMLQLRSAMQGAWLNVLINISSIKDAAFAAAARTEGEALLAEALPLAEAGWAEICRELGG